MQIVDFYKDYAAQAQTIAHVNYREERGHVPALPSIDEIPSLDGMTGVAVVENGGLLGFLCWYAPWENHFGLSRGTWSPVHAHGAVAANRVEIYLRLYQEAAARLVADGVYSHSVTIYAHDAAANEAFVQNGFGRRCVDAIRMTEPLVVSDCAGVLYRMAVESDAAVIADMRNMTAAHLSHATMFMPPNAGGGVTPADVLREMEEGEALYFLALGGGRPVAYYRLKQAGETFAAADDSVMNIHGAYALPDMRGTGVAAGLLTYVTNDLRERGFQRCGVDYECFNHAGRRFWEKYFTPYTSSLHRRIDERILSCGSTGVVI